jgi:signal transduction histidine kinase
MSTLVPCPRCNQPVDSQIRVCPHCGVDLARAALLAEHALASVTAAPVSGPITPEILVPRIGEYLLERGVLSQADLDRAVTYHQQEAAEGKRHLMGQVLLEMGLVDRETLDQVITEQILQLQSALQQTNRQLDQRVQERTRELQNALVKLSELNQLKSNFVSNVSHELRTPLTHLRGYLDLMSGGSLGPLSEDQRSALRVLLRSEARLEELIDELIQFSLASSEALFLDLKAVDLYQVVTAETSKAADKIRARGLSLTLNLSAGIPAVRVDEEKIAWVVHELLDNAIKFTPSGGRITVSLRNESQLIFCSVSDTGIGIPPSKVSEIFEPFHQLDGSVTRRYGGVGLGLSLVRKIIEAHGSSIEVYSEEGKGSQFEFYLPIDSDFASSS